MLATPRSTPRNSVASNGAPSATLQVAIQAPLAANLDQIGFALPVRQQRALPFAADEGNAQAAIEGPDGNQGGRGELPRTRCGRRRRRLRCRAESASGRFVELVGVGHLGDGADGGLRRSGGIARVHRGSTACADRTGGTSWNPRHAPLMESHAELNAASVREQRVCLRAGRNEFQLCRQVHGSLLGLRSEPLFFTRSKRHFPVLNVRARFLPVPQGKGFRARRFYHGESDPLP